MKINYHGGGYVGLTGALHYILAGHDVVITDPDQTVVDAINAGKPKAGGFLDYLDLDAELALLEVRAQTASDLDADVHILAVPSERGGEPFMGIVEEMFTILCATAKAGAPIIVESTLMPGMAARLRRFEAAAAWKGLHHPWAIAPRRDWFADRTKNLRTLTRIVGVDGSFLDAIRPLIDCVCVSVQFTTPETAEITKALENALLHVPVVLLHELAMLFPDYDITEAARLASTHWRFRSLGELYLGLGTGGRCVPLGSKYLNERGGALLGDAIEIDETFASMALIEIFRGLPEDYDPQKVLILGVAYRPGFKDAGNSPGLRAAFALDKYSPDVWDPYFLQEEIQAMRAKQGARCAAAYDAIDRPLVADYRTIVLTVAHPEFSELWRDLRPGSLVIDATGMWEEPLRDRAQQDLQYTRPGRPGWIASPT